MKNGHDKAATGDPVVPARRDRGVTFIEMLVAIVLLGTAVVATLTAVRVTVVGSRLERDHARAQAWLQSSIEVLQATERVGCDPIGDPPITPDVLGTYQQEIRDHVVSPPGWNASAQLSIAQVRYWDGSTYQAGCFDDAGFRLQLVEIHVTSPDGVILETVEVVKDDPEYTAVAP